MMKTVSALTTSTSIPTAVRGQVRAYLKARAGWSRWAAHRGLDSRKAKNVHLLEFAIDAGFEAEVLSIIYGGKPSDYANASAVVVSVPKAPEGIFGYTPGMSQKDAEIAALDVKPSSTYAFSSQAAWAATDEEIVAAMPAIAEDYAVAEGSQEHFTIINGDAVSTSVETVQEALAGYADEANVSDILAGVDQFLSPYVRAEIEKAMQPLIDAANAPAQVIEVEKIVTVAAQPVAPAGALPYATPDKTVEIGKIFGFKGSQAHSPITMWDSHGAAPAIDPHYVVDPFTMRMLATALERGTNVWLVGPGGSGKTSLPEQFCAYTGRPFVRINFTRNSHVDDMVGGQGVKQGDSGWEDGVLLQAMQRPGTVILLDEITLAPAGVQGLYQGCADEHRTYTRPNGQKIVAAPGVVFVVADNTNGTGDDTGMYHGTNPANAALINRFGRMLRIDYMSKAQEAKAIVNHCIGCPLPAAEHLAEFVARARKLPQMENVVISLRNMNAFVRCVQDGFTPKEAAEVTFLNRLPNTERAALEVLFTLNWETEFAALVAGSQKDVAPAPVQAGRENADQGVFDDEVTATLKR